MLDIAKVDNINTAIGGASTAQAKLDQTFGDFVLLLTTQLKNQDPTEPLDTNQITDQITSISQVQEQLNTNSYLEQLVSLFGGNQLDSAVSYIGRVIEAPGNESLLLTNGEESAGVFLYDLPVKARSVEIIIRDENQQIVYKGEALGEAGRNEVLWDGFNNQNQSQQDPGTYSFSILAKDFQNNDITATRYTTGIVTSADTQSGDVVLSLGDIKIPVDSVTAIKTAQELL